jgi:membrane protein
MTNLKLALKHFGAKKLTDSVAVLSFSTLFAIIPTITLAFSVFALSPYFAELQTHLEKFLFQQMLPQNYDNAIIYIQKFITSAQKIKGISLFFLLVVVILLFREVDKRINLIWDNSKNRNLGKGIALYVSSLVLGPLLIGASLFVSSYISTSEVFIFIPMGGIFISSLPIILSGFGVSILYYASPLKKPKAKNAIKAGMLAAFLLEVVKSIMLVYINYFPLYELIYGTMSMLLLFMLWVYSSWLIVLFGGCYCYILENKSLKNEGLANKKELQNV